ncbi:MAG TPA: hypothetical protein EYH43_03185 [Persephonella sp.]|nr:hypothetical protein [Hydrogenothermaceae bacterium]HIQ24966.1 hypothetical protein [Persephonella sp.]
MIRVFILIFLLFSFSSFADDLQTLKDWIKKYENSLYVSFQQITKIKELEEETIFNGFLCKYKDLLKIVYENKETGETQEILIKNNKAYIYSQADNTLIITKVDNSLFIYKLFKEILEKPQNLEKNFYVIENENSLEFIPKVNSDFKKFKIIFSKNNIKKIKSQDKEGNEIIFNIKEIKNCDKEPSLNIRDNTEIIKQY